MSDRGSVTLVTLAFLAVLLAVGVGVGGAGQVADARARAQAAADAAALAAAPLTFRPGPGVGSPTQAAALLAAANGAKLVACVCELEPSWDRRTVEVEVVVAVNLLGVGRREVRAGAWAEFDPVALLP